MSFAVELTQNCLYSLKKMLECLQADFGFHVLLFFHLLCLMLISEASRVTRIFTFDTNNLKQAKMEFQHFSIELCFRLAHIVINHYQVLFERSTLQTTRKPLVHFQWLKRLHPLAQTIIQS